MVIALDLRRAAPDPLSDLGQREPFTQPQAKDLVLQRMLPRQALEGLLQEPLDPASVEGRVRRRDGLRRVFEGHPGPIAASLEGAVPLALLEQDALGDPEEVAAEAPARAVCLRQELAIEEA